MHRCRLARLLLIVVSLSGTVVLLACGSFPAASQATAISSPQVNDSDRVVRGSVPPLAQAQHSLGRVSSSMPAERVVLVLQRRPGADAELETLLQQQHDPSSPLYHHWLTPAEFGSRFGVSDADLTVVTRWLEANGLRVEEIAQGRGWITFSGTIGQVERAFQTEIDEFRINGKLHHANIFAPSIPRALANIVNGPLTLHDFRKQPANYGLRRLPPANMAPNYTSSSGDHYLAPADFATIYNVQPLYDAGIDGTGQSIAIVARTDIHLDDVRYFRSHFGLPANDPVPILNGNTDPGIVAGDETEADLDVQWAGAVARNATIKLVTSASTLTTDGIDLSASYIVDHDLAPVMSTSYGSCEQDMGSTETSFYQNLWAQAAAEGITSFVSAGDSGVAGCNSGGDSAGFIRAISGLCSTPYNVCVGGTEFNEGSTPGYWLTGNDPTYQSSALSYIPEVVWNESGTVTGGSDLWATGGGKSSVFSKPAWQIAPGVPADGKRDVPDVSLSAAMHDAYLIVQGQTLWSVGGTSASSPSFAGLMALVLQKTGSAQGNANTVFYPMAQDQYTCGGPAVYHDVQNGNNSVPLVSGYSANFGYDLASGLGSVDANALVNQWDRTGCMTMRITPAFPPSEPHSNLVRAAALQLTPVSGFNGSVHLACISGLPAGASCQFIPSTDFVLSRPTTVVLQISIPSDVVPGYYRITIQATATDGLTVVNNLLFKVG